MNWLFCFLLAFVTSFAAFWFFGCSDDSSSTASDDKNPSAETLAWNENVNTYDSFAELPSCNESSGYAQVYDDKSFYGCKDGVWEDAFMVFPSYDSLVTCKAALNGFSVIVKGDKDSDLKLYVCDEGKWTTGNKENTDGRLPSKADVKENWSGLNPIPATSPKIKVYESGMQWYFVRDVLKLFVFPSYKSLPKCDAKANGINATVKENGEESVYTCKEGEWVEGTGENAR